MTFQLLTSEPVPDKDMRWFGISKIESRQHGERSKCIANSGFLFLKENMRYPVKDYSCLINRFKNNQPTSKEGPILLAGSAYQDHKENNSNC
jgi:hypothetical protein